MKQDINPWEVSSIEWNRSTFTVRPLSEEEIERLVRQVDFGQTENQEIHGAPIFMAKLDDMTVVALAKSRPTSNQDFSLLKWVELIPNGKEILSEEEHREIVKNALVQGLSVPAEVLATYPGLA